LTGRKGNRGRRLSPNFLFTPINIFNQQDLIYFLNAQSLGLRDEPRIVRKMNLKIKFFFILSVTIMACPLFGQTDSLKSIQNKHDSLEKIFLFFGSDDLLEMNLNFDLGTYQKKKLKGLSLDGNLTIHSGSTDSLRKNVRLKTRGYFRFNICSMPPMEIIFKKPVHAYQDSGMFKKLKLVTQCQASNAYSDYVLKEYLVYRIFNLFTDTSFRVRLVKVHYIDNQNDKKPLVQYGFFIEPVNVLAERLSTLILKNVQITQKSVIPMIMMRIAIFNYMIGNYDWAVPNQHNVAILKSKDPFANQLAVAVPYDFDWSGFVNPTYAIPVEELGIATVKERLYTGICLSRDGFTTELQKFLPYKKKIYSLINEFPYLNQRSKKEMIDYLNEFYSKLESTNGMNMIIDNLESTCKHL
jgi:hypothetical protein